MIDFGRIFGPRMNNGTDISVSYGCRLSQNWPNWPKNSHKINKRGWITYSPEIEHRISVACFFKSNIHSGLLSDSEKKKLAETTLQLIWQKKSVLYFYK